MIMQFIFVFVYAVVTQSVRSQTDYTRFTQPDDIISGAFDDFSRNPSTICARRCGGAPKICYWRFEVQSYSVLGAACRNCPNNPADCNLSQCVTADGFRKNIMAVNRMIPGPSIQVCMNDTIIIDVHNTLLGKHTTLHWHGILQKGTPWMDGVYMITQCPISPGQSFRYKFTADRPGTHYWHDHSGLVKMDGIQSSMVVREIPTNFNNMDQYDFDLPSHTLFIQDWKHFMADQDMPVEVILPDNKIIDAFLINGKGVNIINPDGSVNPLRDYNAVPVKTPLNVVNVVRNNRYRIRLVGGMCMNCGVRVSVDRHRLTVIASDGDPVRPRTVDYITLLPGERYDVVLRADQPVSTYWMIVQGIGLCQSSYQVGLVRYAGSNMNLPGSNNLAVPQNPVTGNAANGICNDGTEICIHQLRNNNIPIPRQIYEYFYNYRQLIQFGFYQYNLPNTRELWQPNTYRPYYEPLPNIQVRPLINNITFLEPSSPLLTQYGDVPRSSFCSDTCRRYRSPRECICLDPIKVPINSPLDIIITDTDSSDGLSHPFHLHGHIFYVLETGMLGNDYDASLRQLMSRVENGNIPVNNPPGKDTIPIANGGYAIIRLVANNPGMWLLHCHFLYHHLNGMTTVVQVGEPNQWPRPPPGFPTCQNFMYG